MTYMRKLILFILLCRCFEGVLAEQIITKETNSPRKGDVLHRQKIEYVNPGDSGLNNLWDLRDMVIMDGTYETAYFTSDSLLGLKDRKTCYYYKVISDTLFGCGYKNYQTQMYDSVASIEMIYPLRYNDKHTHKFHLKGKYHQICNIEAIGKTIIHADGMGTILFPNNDTITNVIRVSKEHKSFVRINRDDFIYPIDTLGNTILQHIEKTYQWYSTGSRYPILETETHIYRRGNKTLSQHKTAYMFPPQEQIFNNVDETNISAKSNTLFNHLKTDKEYSSLTNIHINVEEISITDNYNNLNININANNFAEFEMILSDVQGRVWKTVPKDTLLHYNIDISDVPSGSYLLTIISANEIITKKISLKTH